MPSAKAATHGTSRPPRRSAGGHVAVIHVHGMGSQRRFEETSLLIDGLDAYLTSASGGEDGAARDKGLLRDIEPASEPHQTDEDRTVTYIGATYIPPAGNTGGGNKEIRFYEAYWAPVMANSSSARRVFWWIIRQSPRPIAVLLTPWRERARLRRASLLGLAETYPTWVDGTDRAAFDRLLHIYEAFGGLDAQRAYPKGKHKEFQKFIADTAKPAEKEVLTRLSNDWRRTFCRTQWRNFGVILTILLCMILVFGLLTWVAVTLLAGTIDLIQSNRDIAPGVASALLEKLKADWPTAAGMVASLLLAAGSGFLVNRMFDVEAWSTYEETDEKHERREKVLKVATDLMQHVLLHPDCERVVVTAHSLGTSVAHDALLRLRRMNEVSGNSDPISGPLPLTRIRHFVTFGSPVDKINYFFESARSRSHRYRRVVEKLRGDISRVPFSRNRKPYVHWINYWDSGDIISGPLQSPVGAEDLALRVDNVHLAGQHFPDPARSHNGYFRDRIVIDALWQTICWNRWAYDRTLPLIAKRGYDYESVRQGPGANRAHALLLHVPALLAPWSGLAWVAGNGLGLSGLATAAAWVTLACLGVVVLSAAVNFPRGSRSGI